MKQHQLTENEIASLLSTAEVGRIATLNANGFPYVVPVHYICANGKIYIHGLVKGQKIQNIKENSKVCFEIDEMGRILPDENEVCDTNTEFRSVIILGNARMIDDASTKIVVLKEVVKKYTPQLAHLEFPEKMLNATGIIEITIVECTGKYYK